jgi:hypothetical protein
MCVCRLEHTEGLNTQEEQVGEAGRHNFLSNVPVPHQVQTEERRMEIVKVTVICYKSLTAI